MIMSLYLITLHCYSWCYLAVKSSHRIPPPSHYLQVRGPVTTAFRLRHTQSLFCALDNCRDIVQITDSDHKVAIVVNHHDLHDIIFIPATITRLPTGDLGEPDGGEGAGLLPD